MNPVVIIPTIYGTQRRRAGRRPTSVFDHPSDPNNAAELTRCLESLRRVSDLGAVLVLVAADPVVRERAAETVEKAVSNFPDLDIMVVAEPELRLLHERLDQLGAAGLEREIGFSGYAGIRNVGLAVAHIMGFDSVVFLDDDEIIDDPDWLHKGIYGLGKLTRRGMPILAKTGYYYNAEGNYLSMSQDRWYNRYWEKGKAFNAWISQAMAGPRLSRSNHVCGGCLALHVEAFKRMAFDPWIPRGEDLDYLLNLRMYGSDIWFDNQWNLIHLPPKTANEGNRFRQDIYRWLYEFRKMEFSRTQIDLLQISPSSLEPYPGPFLQPGILKRIKRTAFLRSLSRPNKMAYRKAAKEAANAAAEYATENCSKYFEFQFVWPEVMNRIENDKVLRTALMQSTQLRRKNLGLDGDQPVQQPSIDPGHTGEIRLNLAD